MRGSAGALRCDRTDEPQEAFRSEVEEGGSSPSARRARRGTRRATASPSPMASPNTWLIGGTSTPWGPRTAWARRSRRSGAHQRGALPLAPSRRGCARNTPLEAAAVSRQLKRRGGGQAHPGLPRLPRGAPPPDARPPAPARHSAGPRAGPLALHQPDIPAGTQHREAPRRHGDQGRHNVKAAWEGALGGHSLSQMNPPEARRQVPHPALQQAGAQVCIGDPSQPDRLAASLPIVSPASPSSFFEPYKVAPSLIVPALLQTAAIRPKRIVDLTQAEGIQDRKAAEAGYAKTIKETAAAVMSRPLSEKEVTNRHRPFWNVTQKFTIQQGAVEVGGPSSGSLATPERTPTTRPPRGSGASPWPAPTDPDHDEGRRGGDKEPRPQPLWPLPDLRSLKGLEVRLLTDPTDALARPAQHHRAAQPGHRQSRVLRALQEPVQSRPHRPEPLRSGRGGGPRPPPPVPHLRGSLLRRPLPGRAAGIHHSAVRTFQNLLTAFGFEWDSGKRSPQARSGRPRTSSARTTSSNRPSSARPTGWAQPCPKRPQYSRARPASRASSPPAEAHSPPQGRLGQYQHAALTNRVRPRLATRLQLLYTGADVPIDVLKSWLPSDNASTGRNTSPGPSPRHLAGPAARAPCARTAHRVKSKSNMFQWHNS